MKRNLLILGSLLVVLWAAWFFSSRAERRKLSVSGGERDFFRVDTLAIDSAAFKYADWTYLAKHGDGWKVIGSGWEYPADEALLSRVLRTTNDMTLEDVISTSPAKFRKFEVDTSIGRVMRLFANGAPAAEFVIGKLGTDQSHTYVRKIDSDTVYLARGEFSQLFTMMPDQWKSRVIMDLDSTRIDTIRWVYTKSETRLARGPDRKWTVWKTGLKNPQPVDTAAVNAKLRYFSPLRTPAFHPEGNPNVATFDTLELQLIVSTYDGRADTVIWNKLPKKAGRIFARRPGRPEPTFLFTPRAYENVAARYEDLVFVDTTASSS